MGSPKIPRNAGVVGRGLDSLSLDPGPRMQALRRRIRSRRTVAEAWEQTNKVMREAMDLVKAQPRA
jgi:hypothetical protein